jgi:hypothetical protein
VDVNREAAHETVDIIQGEGRAADGLCLRRDEFGAGGRGCGCPDSMAVSTCFTPMSVMRQWAGPIKLDEAASRRTIDLNVTSCFIAAPLRRDRQGFVPDSDPLHGLLLRRLLCRQGGSEQFHDGLGPAVRKERNPRQRGDTRPDEYAAHVQQISGQYLRSTAA